MPSLFSERRALILLGAVVLSDLASRAFVRGLAQSWANSHLTGPLLPALYLLLGASLWIGLAVGLREMASAPSRGATHLYRAAVGSAALALAYWTYALSTLECQGCLMSG